MYDRNVKSERILTKSVNICNSNSKFSKVTQKQSLHYRSGHLCFWVILLNLL